MVMGLPAKTTTTVFGFAAATAAMSPSWPWGRLSERRSKPSDSRKGAKPTQTMATSARGRSRTASSKAVAWAAGVLGLAAVALHVAAEGEGHARPRRPPARDAIERGDAVPGDDAGAAASAGAWPPRAFGPMTAMRAGAVRGSRSRSLRRSTMPAAAASRLRRDIGDGEVAAGRSRSKRPLAAIARRRRRAMFVDDLWLDGAGLDGGDEVAAVEVAVGGRRVRGWLWRTRAARRCRVRGAGRGLRCRASRGRGRRSRIRWPIG